MVILYLVSYGIWCKRWFSYKVCCRLPTQFLLCPHLEWCDVGKMRTVLDGSAKQRPDGVGAQLHSQMEWRPNHTDLWTREHNLSHCNGNGPWARDVIPSWLIWDPRDDCDEFRCKILVNDRQNLQANGFVCLSTFLFLLNAMVMSLVTAIVKMFRYLTDEDLFGVSMLAFNLFALFSFNIVF